MLEAKGWLGLREQTSLEKHFITVGFHASTQLMAMRSHWRIDPLIKIANRLLI
jgi:hypothetical protein